MVYLGPLKAFEIEKKEEEDKMGKSISAGIGPYRDSQKFVKAIICMADGTEFEYSTREIRKSVDGKDVVDDYSDFKKDCYNLLCGDKIIRLPKALIMVDHIQYVRFEVTSSSETD